MSSKVGQHIRLHKSFARHGRGFFMIFYHIRKCNYSDCPCLREQSLWEMNDLLRMLVLLRILAPPQRRALQPSLELRRIPPEADTLSYLLTMFVEERLTRLTSGELQHQEKVFSKLPYFKPKSICSL